MMNTQTLLGILIGYLLGSIPFTQLIARWHKGIDLRTVGSQNVGGMNAMQNIGLGWGFLAGALDVAKGAAALVIAEAIGAPMLGYLWAGLAAVAGHNWPVWLGFRGGKGIAVTIGLGVWLAFPEMLIGFLVSLVILKLTSNIVFTALGGFLLTIGLMGVWGRPPEYSMVMWGSAIIMLTATLPNIIRTLRQPGGLQGWLKKPMQAYEKDSEETTTE